MARLRGLIRLRLDILKTLYVQSFNFQYDASVCDYSMAVLVPHMEDQQAGRLAHLLARLMCSEVGVNNKDYGMAVSRYEGLNVLLTRYSRQDKIDDTEAMDGDVRKSEGRSNSVRHCRLTTQELVDLLKFPTCIGLVPARFSNHLENRYGQLIINHWAFVRYANENGLEIDFTSPPKRPDGRNRSNECWRSWIT